MAINDKVYTIEDDGKTLKKACSDRGLPSGTKKNLLLRLHNFKLKMKWEFEDGVAKKMYEEDKRKPVQIKVPQVPS